MPATETLTPAAQVRAHRLLAVTIGSNAEQERKARVNARTTSVGEAAHSNLAADRVVLTTLDAIHRFLNS